MERTGRKGEGKGKEETSREGKGMKNGRLGKGTDPLDFEREYCICTVIECVLSIST